MYAWATHHPEDVERDTRNLLYVGKHTSFRSDLYDTPRQGIFRRGGSIKLEVVGRLLNQSC